MKFLQFLIIYGITCFGYSQEFKSEELTQIKQLTRKVEKGFNIVELEKVKPADSAGVLYLHNDLRSSRFLDTDKWLNLREEVVVIGIDIIFSKYPIRNGKYQLYYPLLQKRLINLFEIDEQLNSAIVSWNIILQTDCRTDIEADNLFHGVRIHYEETISPDKFQVKLDEDNVIRDSTVTMENKEFQPILSAHGDIEEVELGLKSIVQGLPKNIQDELVGEPLENRLLITTNYLEKKLEELPETDLSKVDKEFLEKNKIKVEDYLLRYQGFGDNKNNDVYDVLDRHLEWSNALVVADWTGSMYPFGAQVLMWHIDNFKTSGITYFTLFNDGDRKKIKRVGETEGIYFEEADNIDRLLLLYDLVQTKGSGGDLAENDVEAILKGMEKYPDHKEIILIADNNACVRDVELAYLIGKPVRIILCGYNRKNGINPDYLLVADITGGSIHTIENDIVNIEYEKLIKGSGKFSYCHQSEYFNTTVIKDYKLAKQNKIYVKHLNLSGQNLNDMPYRIGRFKRLVTLNLSSNNISITGSAIKNMWALQELDLSDNKLKKFDPSLADSKHLVKLNMSQNDIKKIDVSLHYKYLTNLDLSNNKISNTFYIKCQVLQSLNLSNNQLKSLPKGLRYSKELKRLNLSNNKILKLGKELKYLKKLEEIDLSNCGLTTISKSFTRMHYLKVINLSGNDIPEKEIQHLKKLMPKAEIIYDI